MKRGFRIGDRTVAAEVARLEEGRYRVSLDGVPHEYTVQSSRDGRVRVASEGGAVSLVLTRGDRELFVSSPEYDLRIGIESVHRRAAAHDGHGAGEVSLPMPGRVVRVHVRDGDSVAKGQPLLVVEAMKMEHTLKAARDGVVARLAAREGEMVEAGVILLEIHEATAK